ncbi:MAG: hypothetical protein LBU25_01430 [Treponema sp.]|jgi:hypothetical protein|nr:hypothetical protein [Treponema sp.]
MVRGYVKAVFPRGSWVLLLALLSLASLAAEEGIQPETVPNEVNVLYRIIFDEDFYFIAQTAGPYLWGDSVGPIGAEEAWYLSLEAALSNMPRIAQALRLDPQVDPIRLGVELGVPLILEIQVGGSIENAEVSIAYRIRETFTEVGAIRGQFSHTIPQQEDLFAYFWLPIAGELDTFALRVLKPMVEIRGRKGTVVSGFTPSPQEIPESGSLFLAVPMPGTFSWKALHKQYVPLEGVLLARPEQPVLELKQRRFYPFSLDLGLVQGRSPELWFSWQPNYHGWRLRLGLQQQVLGFGYFSFADSPEIDRRSLWLPGVEGAYRLPIHESGPQLFVAAALLGRWYDTSGVLGVRLGSALLSLGYDWEIPGGFRLFAEVGLGFFLEKGFVSADRGNLLQLTLGDAGYLELPRFRLGIRVPLGKWEIRDDRGSSLRSTGNV